jgi:molybdate transport system substrate-binding protein
VDAFRAALLRAQLIVMPGSTSGLFIKEEVLPKLAIADKVSSQIVARGTESTGMLAAGKADLAIGPISELVNQPGVELVGPLPEAVQLVQVFTAAITKTSHRPEEARRLTEFLVSERTTAAIKRAGMEPVGDHSKP